MEEKKSIRIGQKNTIKIEVNDNGDCIEFNPDDKRFSIKINKFYRDLKALIGEAEKEISKFQALGKKATDEDVLAALDYDATLSEKLAKCVDEAFGTGTCDKVFGKGVVPSIDSVSEFCNAITPYINEAVQTRRKSVSGKYSADRNGGGV